MSNTNSKVPEHIHELISGFIALRNEPYTRDNEVNVLRMLVVFGEDDLKKCTSPNPELLNDNLKWFLVRLDELGAGRVRA